MSENEQRIDKAIVKADFSMKVVVFYCVFQLFVLILRLITGTYFKDPYLSFLQTILPLAALIVLIRWKNISKSCWAVVTDKKIEVYDAKNVLRRSVPMHAVQRVFAPSIRSEIVVDSGVLGRLSLLPPPEQIPTVVHWIEARMSKPKS